MEQTSWIKTKEEPVKESLEWHKLKYKELGRMMQDAGIPGETIRAVRELSTHYKFINKIGNINIDDIKIRAKEKNKGRGLRFFVRKESDYKRLKETYEQKSTLSMNTALLIKNTYGS